MAIRIMTSFVVITLVLLSTICDAQLSSTFYDGTCPNALSTIRTAIRTAVSKERRMAASLIRLHFHDCFVQGCDASILLDDTSTIESEKSALPNVNSVRGFEVIDKAKADVEKVCPGVVSCADIVAVAARDASFAVGGPSWTVKLGRRDSTTASKSLANTNLPLFTDDLQTLISHFTNRGLTAKDMVTLSGAHTIGQAQCFTFRGRIYNNASDIDAGFASTRQRGCPSSISTANNQKLAALDLVTPNSFDNNYFKNLIQKKGLLQSDQVLFSGGSTDSIVSEYSKNPTTFKSDFAAAMIKMGDIEPLTGSAGIIRSAHTIGQAQCFTFRGRIYNNASDIDAGFASTRQRGCPSSISTANNQKLAALDLVTPNSFDNNYFKNLIQKKGLLQSYQVLFSGGSTDSIVSEYSKNPTTFKSDFAAAMIKMGDIEPLTGSAGIIRSICSAIN